MAEMLALVRLGFAKSRKLIIGSALYFVAIHLLMLAYGASGLGQPEQLRTAVTVITCYLSLPLLGIGLAVFDFNETADLASNASGYRVWLLRSPLPSWKLAAVPLAMKTLWVMLVVGGITITSGAGGISVQRWFLPSIGLATLLCLACLLTWQPFRFHYTRLVLCFLLFLPANGWLHSAVMLAFDFGITDVTYLEDHRGVELAAAWIIFVSGYLAVVLLSLRAVRLARFNAAGRAGETSLWPSGGVREPNRVTERVRSTDVPRPASSNAGSVAPIKAVLKYDIAKLNRWVIGATILSWLIILCLWSPLDIGAVTALVVLLTFQAVFLCERLLSGREEGFLPKLLARSPISSASLAWTQQFAATGICLLSLANVPLMIGVWYWRGTSDAFFRSWNAAMESGFGSPSAGWRIAVVVAVAGAMLITRQSTWMTMISSTGNQRYAYYSLAIKLLVSLTLFSWLLFHFLQFPNWEAWSQWTWQRVAQSTVVLPWVLLAKLVIVIAATAMLMRSQLVKPGTAVGLLVCYALLTVTVSWATWRMVPGESFLLWHSLACVAFLMPYSRIVLSPICLAGNRHR